LRYENALFVFVWQFEFKMTSRGTYKIPEAADFGSYGITGPDTYDSFNQSSEMSALEDIDPSLGILNLCIILRLLLIA